MGWPDAPCCAQHRWKICTVLQIHFTQEDVMTELSALWLPILLSSVIVFVASSIIHMAPLWHKNDYPRLANED